MTIKASAPSAAEPRGFDMAASLHLGRAMTFTSAQTAHQATLTQQQDSMKVTL
jgi:hypothetical protein